MVGKRLGTGQGSQAGRGSYMKRLILGMAVAAVLVMGGLTFSIVLAHNAGHHHLPNGECVDVGSGKHAHNPEKQDKDPDQRGDQYGARWAAEQGNTPI